VPRLKEIHNMLPRTKITVLDVSDSILTSLDNKEENWVLNRREGISVGMVFRYNHFYFSEVRKQFDKNLKICVIIGIDKPRTHIQDNMFYVRFSDTAVNLSSIVDHNEYPNAKMEYFYWNDPIAGLKNATPNGTAIINKSNPYNFKYTYNNTVLYSQVNVTFVCNDIITLKVNGSTILNNGTLLTIYTQTVSINSGNNLFEFLCYNTLGPAVFAAYVVSTDNSTYLFSTNYTTIGWSVEVSGFFSNGYPVSALLANESSVAKTDIGTTFFRSQNLDLSSNQANQQVPALDLFFRTNNVDFKDQFFKYV
jgi:hypothetical protein